MYNQYLSVAVDLAENAGKMMLPYAGKAGHQTLKASRDFVTEMDLKVEDFIISSIKETYPDHHIFSEEIGSIEGTGDFEWVIDPIDGTVNYSVGLPLYGVSIALTHNGEPVVSAICLPALGETFWAAKGEGAFLNNKPINVREVNLSQSFVSFGDFAKDGNKDSNKERLRILETIVNGVYRIRMIGTAAVTLAYIAAGRLDAALYINPNWYDVAAGQLLITESGGIKQSAGKYTLYANKQAANELSNLLLAEEDIHF